jgi:branched-chain amino acid transport system permease protein
MQQAFLRWTQGQELRQALITIAVSVIIADQIIAHFPRKVSTGAQKFGGNAVDLTWPGWVDNPVNLHVGGILYSGARLAVLAIGVAVGVGLWLWLYRTKTGMKIRAGVDDEKMTSALGINIQVTFAITFAVGCMLAALGAVVWASQSNISSGQDGQWLLNSLVVVIVGGMGSIFGAAAGALLFAFVANFSAAYLPTTGTNCCTQYSTIFTFVLIALVLSFRPRGLFGRAA